ncbi:ABC transporter substrate-binding protein [Ornithinibacillus sp. BX22]|uniref:ABC transporter substrate-binding protein n=1 Tax=Ornithinibacillus hominis TaxID=2763055 RepID=A0A923L7N6_9BACI|nr:ABC transporter substrate-binding protein [Ornithinibacillus hominis]MBC5638011.1 ABC transporter substrate-binding protein [Ornithinibacillus hominis]
MRKFVKVFILLVLVIVPVLAACGADNTSGDEGTGDKYKVGILAPAVTHGWVAAVAYHAENRAKELSDEIEYQIYTSSDASEMTSQLDDLITWGAEAIVAFPQWEGMEVPIQRALDEGIKVVNFDIVIDVDDVYRVAGDNYDMGVQGANYIVDKIGTEGEVVILEVPSSGSVSELRTGGFLDTIEEIAPDINLHTYATQFTREDGLKDFADILTSLNHIDAVFSLDDETSIGVLQAIDEAGRSDIQVVTGGGGMQEYFNMMPENEDIWIQSALYSPAMVQDAVDTAVKILKGEDVEKETIIPTTVVDRDNYEEFLDAVSPY